MKSAKLLIALFVLSVIALSAAGYFYYRYQQVVSKDATRELSQYVQTISSFMELPKDESPTLATVADITKLKNQPFFKNAKNGDKVMIYVKAQKAILYRPSTKKVIDVGPITIQNNNVSGAATTPSPTP